jgi:isopenicillin N synthase-like dioxygenase
MDGHLTTGLPVLDAALLDGNASDRAAFARAMRDACVTHGFFYIRNHGVDLYLLEDVLEQSRLFFSMPLEVKLQADKSRSFCNRGYEKLRDQVLEAGTPPDVKEGYYMGAELPLDDPRVIARKFNHGPNLWPAQIPGFRPAMQAYMEAVRAVAERLLRGLALSLDLNEPYFDRFCEAPMEILRLLHYPPQPGDPLPDEKGCGAHTDWGCLTLLWQDENGGLQVQGADGRWMDAPPILNTFVVNIGDMVARWTNDRYRSTLHRVVNLSGQDRYSIPYFYEGNCDHLVECLPTCLADGQTPRYAPVTVTEHLMEMYRRTYA